MFKGFSLICFFFIFLVLFSPVSNAAVGDVIDMRPTLGLGSSGHVYNPSTYTVTNTTGLWIDGVVHDLSNSYFPSLVPGNRYRLFISGTFSPNDIDYVRLYVWSTPLVYEDYISYTSDTFTVDCDFIADSTSWHLETLVVGSYDSGDNFHITYDAFSLEDLGSQHETIVHTITSTSDIGGSISPSGAVSVEQSGSQTFTISPISGYVVDDVLVDGVSVGPVSSYTFTDLQADSSILAKFKVKDSPPPSGGAGGGGDLTVFEIERVQEAGNYIISSMGTIFSVALWIFMGVLGLHLAIDILSEIAR